MLHFYLFIFLNEADERFGPWGEASSLMKSSHHGRHGQSNAYLMDNVLQLAGLFLM